MVKKKIVTVSGGFDPMHIGHIHLFKKAKKLGNHLTVILNNDNWLKSKKGFVFMQQDERRKLLLSLSTVDEVIITRHKPNDPDKSVCRELELLKPYVFANGGDRENEQDIPESAICKKHNIRMIFNVGGKEKIQSSSWLTDKLLLQKKKNIKPWGRMETVKHTKNWWLKTLAVAPGQSLSLQKHKKRSEIWICVEGEMIVEINNKKTLLKIGDFALIKKNETHRLSSKKGGTIVEVGLGTTMLESDITRYKDNYGRK